MKELFEYFGWENFIIAVCLAIAAIAFVILGIFELKGKKNEK